MAFMPQEVISQVLALSDIVEVISSYLPLRLAGKNYKALCPFHTEKTPSFVVNPERQIFHCFGCGEGGNVLSFLMKRENFSFPEAVRFLAARAGISLPVRVGSSRREEASGRLKLCEVNRIAANYYRQNLWETTEGALAREHLQKRGVDEATAKCFELGYALPSWDALWCLLRGQGYSPEFLVEAGLILPRTGEKKGYYDRFRERLIIPIFDATGKVLAFGGRALGEAEAKYINSPETPIYNKGSHLYGLNFAHKAIREKGFVLVVEGYFDLIIMHRMGFQNTVASLGTSLTSGQVALLKRYTDHALLVFDPDRAGMNAALRAMELLLSAGLGAEVVVLNNGEDPDSFLRRYGQAALEERLKDAVDLVDFFLKQAYRSPRPDTIDGQAHLGERILPIIAKIEGRIRRAKYVQKLAERLGVSEATVVAELRRMTAGGRNQEKAASGREKVSTEADFPEEEKLIQLVLLFPEILPGLRGALALEELSDPVLRRIWSRLQDRSPRTGRDLLAEEVDEEVRRRLACLLFAEEGEFPEPERMAWDCLGRIKDRSEKRLKADLSKKMKEAEKTGDLKAAAGFLAEHPSVKKQKS